MNYINFLDYLSTAVFSYIGTTVGLKHKHRNIISIIFGLLTAKVVELFAIKLVGKNIILDRKSILFNNITIIWNYCYIILIYLKYGLSVISIPQ